MYEGYFGKVYTQFEFQGQTDLKGLHCTHKYFGDCSMAEWASIKETLDSYFRKNLFQGFVVQFDYPQHFGTQKVLLPFSKKPFLPELRSKLDRIKKSEHGFRPHCSVPEFINGITVVVADYVLIADKQVHWRASDLGKN